MESEEMMRRLNAITRTGKSPIQEKVERAGILEGYGIILREGVKGIAEFIRTAASNMHRARSRITSASDRKS